MADQVPMWRASDGSLHESEAAADAHSAALEAEGEIERYLDSKEWANARSRSIARNAVLEFLRWRAQQ